MAPPFRTRKQFNHEGHHSTLSPKLGSLPESAKPYVLKRRTGSFRHQQGVSGLGFLGFQGFNALWVSGSRA